MKYLYYKLWYSFKKIPTNTSPATNAMLLLSTAQFANLLVLAGEINYYIKLNFFSLDKQGIIIYSSLTAAIIIILNYFFLYKKREIIAQKYIQESKQMKKIGYIFPYIYIIGSYILVFVTK